MLRTWQLAAVNSFGPRESRKYLRFGWHCTSEAWPGRKFARKNQHLLFFCNMAAKIWQALCLSSVIFAVKHKLSDLDSSSQLQYCAAC